MHQVHFGAHRFCKLNSSLEGLNGVIGEIDATDDPFQLHKGFDERYGSACGLRVRSSSIPTDRLTTFIEPTDTGGTTLAT